jgi:hypothetical protein
VLAARQHFDDSATDRLGEQFEEVHVITVGTHSLPLPGREGLGKIDGYQETGRALPSS